jgi:hypothetical protein
LRHPFLHRRQSLVRGTGYHSMAMHALPWEIVLQKTLIWKNKKYIKTI